MHKVSCFLETENVKMAEIHQQVSKMHDENITHEPMVRKGVTTFKEASNESIS